MSNRKALGFFKDELNYMPMQEFVGLRPKCFAFLCTGNVDKNVLRHTRPVEKKTAKVVKHKVHFAHYLNTLHRFQSYVCKQNLISSTAHTIRTTHTRKIGLTAFDTKRWLCEDTVHTHSLVIRIPCQIQSIWNLSASVVLWSTLQTRASLTVVICLGHCNQLMVPSEMETLVLRILLTSLILIVPILIVMDSHKTAFVVHLFEL